mmetsp:Transcript_25027/g.47960  ORF Transcript_25027/g.47960 Transcript_25027/m.47960 type:complete len:102 (-) Transcript_25027:26-331(-)
MKRKCPAASAAFPGTSLWLPLKRRRPAYPNCVAEAPHAPPQPWLVLRLVELLPENPPKDMHLITTNRQGQETRRAAQRPCSASQLFTYEAEEGLVVNGEVR